mmetsp:Transcript_23009/g.25559  ORF Transcript_23009/g.25559 Transcript_23009/m.25559 type:complete len:112 (-) Transcript_23009:205-540(-)
MNSSFNLSQEENLSDELTSECFLSPQIKTSPNLIKNMENSPLVKKDKIRDIFVFHQSEIYSKQRQNTLIVKLNARDKDSSPRFSHNASEEISQRNRIDERQRMKTSPIVKS